MSRVKTLKISYDDFLAVLKEWDEYTDVLLNKMPKNGFNVVFINHGQGGDISATDIKMSELTDLLWQSLKFGANKVEAIHSSTFVKEQVEYFIQKFCLEENLTNIIKYSENYSYWYLGNPTEVFAKLGKPAQLQIIQDGLLEIAIANCEKAKVLVYQKQEERRLKDQQESIEWEKQRKQEKVEKELRQKARELDKNKCVFCGNPAGKKFFRFSGDLSIENFVSSCTPCMTKKPFIFLKNERNVLLRFGRFEENQPERKF